MAFAADLSVRGMTDREIDALISDTNLMRTLGRIVQAVHFVRIRGN
jgi:hypothetical protein